MPATDGRPAVAIGHVFLETTEVAATVARLVEMGIRVIFRKDGFAVLELRGATHLVVRAPPDGAALDPTTTKVDKVPLDIMVDDIDAAHARYQALGMTCSSMRRGKIHDNFDVTLPDGRLLEINSSHASGDPV